MQAWKIAVQGLVALGRRRGTGAPSVPCSPASKPFVIPHSSTIDAAKEVLSLALVALIGGNRPAISPAEVWIEPPRGCYHVPVDSFTVSRYAPEDFIREDLMDVLHAPSPRCGSVGVVSPWLPRARFASR